MSGIGQIVRRNTAWGDTKCAKCGIPCQMAGERSAASRETDVRKPAKKVRADSFDRRSERACKPGSVIDSHLSRRTVAGALQPPSRKQPGKPCFLCGVAPDRVYSIGHSRADGCALTAPFHPYLRYLHTSGGLFLLHFSSDRSGRALPVILALWSPDFPHSGPFGLAARLSVILAQLF